LKITILHNKARQSRDDTHLTNAVLQFVCDNQLSIGRWHTPWIILLWQQSKQLAQLFRSADTDAGWNCGCCCTQLLACRKTWDHLLQ